MKRSSAGIQCSALRLSKSPSAMSLCSTLSPSLAVAEPSCRQFCGEKTTNPGLYRQLAPPPTHPRHCPRRFLHSRLPSRSRWYLRSSEHFRCWGPAQRQSPMQEMRRCWIWQAREARCDQVDLGEHGQRTKDPCGLAPRNALRGTKQAIREAYRRISFSAV